MSNKAVFLDRDGVINVDKEYNYKIEEFEFTKNIFENLRLLQAGRFMLFVVTNQSGIGRGYYSLEDFNKLNNYMLNIFCKEHINIKKVYFCPHKPADNCECRKPKIKFIKDAEKEFNLDLENSWVIGDKIEDIKMGRDAGCRALLIESKYTQNSSENKLRDLAECSKAILESS